MAFRFLQLGKKIGAWLVRYAPTSDSLSRLMVTGAVIGYIRPAMESSNPETQAQLACIWAALMFYVAPMVGGFALLITRDKDDPTEEEELAALRLVVQQMVGNEANVHRLVRAIIAETQQEQAQQCSPASQN